MSKLTRVVPYAAGALAVFASVFAVTLNDGRAKEPDGIQIATDGIGNIKLPDVDYRKDWVSLGSWAVAAEEGTQGSKGIHAVYTQLETIEAYRKNGKFPVGAILIKELFSTTTQDMTTGTVSRADKTSGWFVMIKDSEGRFPENKLWGDGWGWAYFDAKDREKTTTTDYKADCKGCHVPAEKNDWVYVEGYPVLKSK